MEVFLCKGRILLYQQSVMALRLAASKRLPFTFHFRLVQQQQQYTMSHQKVVIMYGALKCVIYLSGEQCSQIASGTSFDKRHM